MWGDHPHFRQGTALARRANKDWRDEVPYRLLLPMGCMTSVWMRFCGSTPVLKEY